MSTKPTLIRVAKLGGSLLDFAELPARIDAWLRRRPAMKNILVVGGGHRADLIRQWQERFAIEPNDAHWNCIEMMQLNANMVAAWFPDWKLIDSFEDLSEAGADCPIVFAVKHWLLNSSNPLPESWDVTSDSIAAKLAFELKAQELVMFKSADPPNDASCRSLMEAGYLDRHFAVAAEGQTVQMVNLRGPVVKEFELVVCDAPVDQSNSQFRT